ncbi:MAG: hypothetical protein HY841_01510 [Bacteroidetes bacterium]|nr:hypothetical protein [Bacteroidota bacterium]
MKKTILLFSFLFSVFIFSASAENILLLTNPKTQETEVFRMGSFLVFELKTDKSIHEGFIRDIEDSSLAFDDIMFQAQVSLSQITILAGSTRGKVVAGKVANVVGDALIIAGTAVFDCGLDFFAYSDSYYYWPIGGTIWLAGAFVAGLGYAFDWAACPFDHAVRVRNYRDWNASIVASLQPSSEGEGTKQETSPKQDSTQTPPVFSPENKKSKIEKKKKNKIADDVYGE